MVKAARAAGVPFQEWKADNRDLMLESGAPMRPRVDLSKLDGHWVNAGNEAGVAKDLSQQLPDDIYRYLRFEYLHHSADDGLVNEANRINRREARRMISNLEGSKRDAGYYCHYCCWGWRDAMTMAQPRWIGATVLDPMQMKSGIPEPCFLEKA